MSTHTQTTTIHLGRDATITQLIDALTKLRAQVGADAHVTADTYLRGRAVRSFTAATPPVRKASHGTAHTASVTA